LDGPSTWFGIPENSAAHGLVQNIVALYDGQICTYALPLMTFPYLARVLGPSGWGSVVFAQAIAP
jgi:polysaccharide transporter, PST family